MEASALTTSPEANVFFSHTCGLLEDLEEAGDMDEVRSILYNLIEDGSEWWGLTSLTSLFYWVKQPSMQEAWQILMSI